MPEQVHNPIFARLWDRVITPMSERRGADEHRRKLLDDLSARVIEVGAGQGANFSYYPTSVERVVAVEPEDYLRQRAEQAAISNRALAELLRVIKPGGELRFYEHVIAREPLWASYQRLLDATFWPRVFGGCHAARETGAAIERCKRFTFSPGLLAPLPHILGVAWRPE
jgi:hypothetical protein